MQAPDAAALKRIRDAVEQQKMAQVRLEKLELRFEVEAESALEIEVVRGKPAGRHKLAAGKTRSFRGDQVSLRLPGIASLHLAGPETGRAQYERDAEAADAAVRELCAPFGQSDPDVLTELSNRRTKLEAELLGSDGLRSEVLEGDPKQSSGGSWSRLPNNSGRSNTMSRNCGSRRRIPWRCAEGGEVGRQSPGPADADASRIWEPRRRAS